jgi:hypothetical protein
MSAEASVLLESWLSGMRDSTSFFSNADWERERETEKERERNMCGCVKRAVCVCVCVRERVMGAEASW